MSKVYLLTQDPHERYGRKDINEIGKLIFEAERELEVYDIVKKDNEFYSVSRKNEKGDIVGVDKVDFEINPSPIYNDDFICPYCKREDIYSFEYDAMGKKYCSYCGSELRFERVEQFSTEQLFNIEPIFPTSIIIID